MTRPVTRAIRVRLRPNDAGGLLPHGRSGRGNRRARSRRQRRRVGGQPHAARRSDEPRHVPLRSPRCVAARCSTRAGSHRSTANGRRPPKRRRRNRTFHESLRFPWPKQPVSIVLKKRGTDNTFMPLWSTKIDPASRFVNVAAAPARRDRVDAVRERPACREGGPARHREGYTAKELPKFHADVKRLIDALFAEEPYKSRRHDFNVRGLDIPSAESGVNRPQRRRVPPHRDVGGVQRLRLGALCPDARQPCASRCGVGGAVRVHRDPRQRAARTAAAASSTTTRPRPWTARSRRTCSCTSSVITSRRSPTSTTRRTWRTRPAPQQKPEPWEPNVTALHDPPALKWKDLVTPGTPLPTPWDKEAFEKHTRAIQERRRDIAQAQRARGGDGRALPRAAEAGTRSSWRR